MTSQNLIFKLHFLDFNLGKTAKWSRLEGVNSNLAHGILDMSSTEQRTLSTGSFKAVELSLALVNQTVCYVDSPNSKVFEQLPLQKDKQALTPWSTSLTPRTTWVAGGSRCG